MAEGHNTNTSRGSIDKSMAVLRDLTQSIDRDTAQLEHNRHMRELHEERRTQFLQYWDDLPSDLKNEVFLYEAQGLGKTSADTPVAADNTGTKPKRLFTKTTSADRYELYSPNTTSAPSFPESFPGVPPPASLSTLGTSQPSNVPILSSNPFESVVGPSPSLPQTYNQQPLMASTGVQLPPSAQFSQRTKPAMNNNNPIQSYPTAAPSLAFAQPVLPNVNVAHPTQAHTAAMNPSFFQPSPSVTILPDFQNMEYFSNGPGESWENFIERWEIKIRPYNFSSQQLALTLPDRFKGAAYAKYKRLVRVLPNVLTDYNFLRSELDKCFTLHLNIQGRGLHAIQQGKRTVGEFYAEISSLADSAYRDIPEQYRDTFIVDIFIQGLRESLRKGLAAKGRMTLSQALQKAEILELSELQSKNLSLPKINSVETEEVMAVEHDQKALEPLLAPLKSQIEDLKSLVVEQSRHKDNDYQSRRQNFNNGNSNQQWNRNKSQKNNQGNSNNQSNSNNQRNFSNQSNSNNQRSFSNQSNSNNQRNFSNQSNSNNQNSNQKRYSNNRSNQGRQSNDRYNPNPQQPQSANGQSSRNSGSQNKNTCWNCGSYEHFARGCPQKQVNHIAAELEPEQYAEFLLTQPQELDEFKVNAIEVAPASCGGSGGTKLSAKTSFMLTVLSILALCSNTQAAHVILPDNPMICGSSPRVAHTYNITHEYLCSRNKTSSKPDAIPIKMNLQVYQRNIVEWQTKAFQCTKFKDIITTEISFFTDVKTKTTSKEQLPVTREECELMVSHKTCSAGSLVGSNGVFLTQNVVDAVYVHCCEAHSFEAEQCSYIETSVFKRHDYTEFESPAGDVSHCIYEHGSCVLADRSVLIWNLSPDSFCEYETWFTQEGKLFSDHFVSNDQNLVLTFHAFGYGTHKDCHDNTTSLSDQGLMIAFLNPTNPTNMTSHAEHIKNEYTVESAVEGTQGLVAILNSMVQAVETELHENMVEQFWTDYYYTCHLFSQTLKIITLLMEKHPTLSARYLLQNPNIIASSGPGILEVFPCTELPPDLYTILSMSSNNCTRFIPIEIRMGGSVRIGYLDPVENVVHKDTPSIDCTFVDQTVLRLNGTSFRYSLDGNLSALTNVSRLRLPDVQLGTNPIKLHETVYSTAHRMNWHELSNHHSLNSLLSTLDRQKQVLEAMGVQSSPYRTLKSNVIESSESLLGNSLFSFMFGGHVASGYELWTFGCNIAVTILGLCCILIFLKKRCCPNFKFPRSLANQLVANVDVEMSNAENSSDNENDGEETTALADVVTSPSSTRPGVSQDCSCPVDISPSSKPSTSAVAFHPPPAYKPIYPSLSEVESVRKITWPSFDWASVERRRKQ